MAKKSVYARLAAAQRANRPVATEDSIREVYKELTAVRQHFAGTTRPVVCRVFKDGKIRAKTGKATDPWRYNPCLVIAWALPSVRGMPIRAKFPAAGINEYRNYFIEYFIEACRNAGVFGDTKKKG